MICPQCGSTHVDRDAVDIGVGTQYGPWACYDCGWSERAPDPLFDTPEPDEEPPL